MNNPTLIQIIGAQVACSGGYRDSWRETAAWAAGKLAVQYGDAVRVDYYDLFDPACPPIPANAELPLVLVEGEVLSQGFRISIPAIRKRLEELRVGVE